MANDDELAMEGVKEEAEAYNSYREKARRATSEHTKEVFKDIADEELVHLGEFSEVAEKARPEVAEKVKEGYKEASEMKKSATGSIEKAADTAIDEFGEPIDDSYQGQARLEVILPTEMGKYGLRNATMSEAFTALNNKGYSEFTMDDVLDGKYRFATSDDPHSPFFNNVAIISDNLDLFKSATASVEKGLKTTPEYQARKKKFYAAYDKKHSRPTKDDIEYNKHVDAANRGVDKIDSGMPRSEVPREERWFNTKVEGTEGLSRRDRKMLNEMYNSMKPRRRGRIGKSDTESIGKAGLGIDDIHNYVWTAENEAQVGLMRSDLDNIDRMMSENGITMEDLDPEIAQIIEKYRQSPAPDDADKYLDKGAPEFGLGHVLDDYKDSFNDGVEKSAADFIPSFESMMNDRTAEKNLSNNMSFKKSDPQPNRFNISWLGTGKYLPGMARAHDALRDETTGQFRVNEKDGSIQGCTKTDVPDVHSEHLEKSAPQYKFVAAAGGADGKDPKDKDDDSEYARMVREDRDSRRGNPPEQPKHYDDKHYGGEPDYRNRLDKKIKKHKIMKGILSSAGGGPDERKAPKITPEQADAALGTGGAQASRKWYGKTRNADGSWGKRQGVAADLTNEEAKALDFINRARNETMINHERPFEEDALSQWASEVRKFPTVYEDEDTRDAKMKEWAKGWGSRGDDYAAAISGAMDFNNMIKEFGTKNQNLIDINTILPSFINPNYSDNSFGAAYEQRNADGRNKEFRGKISNDLSYILPYEAKVMIDLGDGDLEKGREIWYKFYDMLGKNHAPEIMNTFSSSRISSPEVRDDNRRRIASWISHLYFKSPEAAGRIASYKVPSRKDSSVGATDPKPKKTRAPKEKKETVDPQLEQFRITMAKFANMGLITEDQAKEAIQNFINGKK